MIGGIYGIIIAALVRIGVGLTDHTTIAGIMFGLLGCCAAGYIGYGVRTQPYLQSPGEVKRRLAQMGAICCYLLTVAVLLFAFS